MGILVDTALMSSSFVGSVAAMSTWWRRVAAPVGFKGLKAFATNAHTMKRRTNFIVPSASYKLCGPFAIFTHTHRAAAACREQAAQQ